MRIGVDATSWVNRRGYGRFARNVIRSLVARDDTTRYVLYIDEHSAREADLPDAAEQRRVRLQRPPTDAAATGSSRPVGDLVRLARAARRDRLDAFVFPSVYTFYPVPGVPTVVGLHDAIAEQLGPLVLPGRRERTLWRIKQRVAVRGAARLFTVSEASRRQLAAHLDLDPSAFAVVPEAPDAAFHPRPADEVARVLNGLGLEQGAPLVVYAAGISPHKNVATLIDAFARVPVNGSVPRLVLAGALESETYASAANDVRRQIAALGIGDRVVLPGFVSDDVLACLYSSAAAAVVPSLAEGFGLPAVEAAGCGAPVVLSELPAHRESLGDGAWYFPATDADALTAHLSRLVADRRLGHELGERSRRAAGRLSWDASADALRDVVHAAAGRAAS